MTLYGLYDSNDQLLAVHATEKGAEENKIRYEKRSPFDVYHIDFVVVHS
jgi:hypothetical protein